MEDDIRQIGNILETLEGKDMATLCAALSLLPDVRKDGAAIIIAAAARIAAEHFPDTDEFLGSLRKAIDENKTAIKHQS